MDTLSSAQSESLLKVEAPLRMRTMGLTDIAFPFSLPPNSKRVRMSFPF